MAKPKINIELLEKVKTRLKRMKHPEHFDMEIIIERNECGTAACFAGHALLLTGMTPKELELASEKLRVVKGQRLSDAWVKAQKALGLSLQQADRLFIASNWPCELAEEFHFAPDYSKERTDIAVKRISRFIATNGAE